MFSISGEVLGFSVFCVFFPVSVFTICDARASGIFFFCGGVPGFFLIVCCFFLFFFTFV